jgi:hypothetical protein
MLENYVMMMNKENDNIYKIKLIWCKFYFVSAFELLLLDKTCNVVRYYGYGFMMFNATFKNISVISWRSVLLVEETTDLSQVTDNLGHSPERGFEFTTSVVIGNDCKGSCKSNYHTITMTPIMTI